MAAAAKKKGKGVKLWVNCGLRTTSVANYDSYAKNTEELRDRLSKPGELAKINHTFNEMRVEPFDTISMPGDVNLLSKSRNEHGGFVGKSSLRANPLMAKAQTVDTNVGFLPAAEEGEEVVPVVCVYRKAVDGSRRFGYLRHVPDGVKQVDVNKLKAKLPAGFDLFVLPANRKWENHPGVGRHSEEQAFAVIAAMIEEDTIQAYLRRDTRQRVQKFGQLVADMRRRERADRGMRAVRRQRDASVMI